MKKAFVTRVVSYLKPVIGYQVLLLILIAVGSVLTLVFPYILKVIIDDVFPNRDIQLLRNIMLLLTAAYVVRALLFFSSNHLAAWIGNKIATHLRKDVFANVLQKPSGFFDKSKTGEIVYRIFNEVNFVQSIMTNSGIRLFNNVTVIISLIVTLCLLNVQLFLSTILIYPLTLLVSVVMNRKVRRSVERLREEEADLLDYFTERVNKIKLIKAFSGFSFESVLLGRRMTALNRAVLKNSMFLGSNQNISALLLSLIPVVVFFYGGVDVLHGAMTIGSLVAFVQYANKLYAPAKDLLGLYADVVRAYVSLDRIFEYLQRTRETDKNLVQGNQVPNRILKVELRSAVFQYGAKIVLEDVNLTFVPGIVYAVIGASGSGKSTLVSLLISASTPQRGLVLWNQRCLSSIDTRNLDGKALVVCQDELFFHASIEMNLRYNLEVSYHEIERVLKLVGMHDDVKALDKGLDSIVGEVKFSSGQLQRLAIARAMLRAPDVLVLDEATSALDSSAENVILTRVVAAYREKILIIISHRLSTLDHANEVVYVGLKKAVTMGSRQSIHADNPIFNSLFRNQLKLVSD